MRGPLPLAAVLVLLSLGAAAACGKEGAGGAPPAGAGRAGLVGSLSCRECHEKFYELWAPSHHGTAMQPFPPALARERLVAPPKDLEVRGGVFAVELDDEGGRVVERRPDGDRVWPMAHAMGGKNVFFFLTPMDRGRLQVLPVAFDVRTRAWYDTTASMVRHAGGPSDAPVAWTDPLLTFNTSCWNCHVSQLSVNYDEASGSYDSRWAEPGINCETCHGPGEEHVRACREAPVGQPPADLRIIRIGDFDERQTNDTCAPCHAKAMVLTRDFQPGDRYFDHYDLTTLEDRDFHPDGRDLGENYTFTGWLMNPCAASGRLDCVHCHTSSGRNRFAGDRANEACLPCHAERVADPEAHTRHPKGSSGGKCVACHMPLTEFARMTRSDHSMRPPMPALTLATGSPNACNLCHADRDAAWADALVRAWHKDDYQAPWLRRAGLVAAARERDWARLDEMLAEVSDPGRDEVVATSLLRLLARCGDPRVVPAFVRALRDPSPLVRSAAASGLEGRGEPEALRALVAATGDESRLVRVRAAGALAGLPPGDLPEADRRRLAAATAEYEAALAVRPDDWSTPYNLGNYRDRLGDAAGALALYEKAARMRPDAEAPWVNAAMVHARAGRAEEAEAALRKALEAAPRSAPAHFNLGLLLAEGGRTKEAVEHLRAALASDPRLAPAAYNLAVLLFADQPDEAIDACRQASAADPASAKYAYTLAYFLHARGRKDAALGTLQQAVARGVADADMYALLARLHEERGEHDAAREALRRAQGARR